MITTNLLIKYNNLENSGYFKIIDSKDLSKTIFYNYSKPDIKFKTNSIEKQDNLISFLLQGNELNDINYINKEINDKDLNLNKLLFAYENLKV